MGPLGFSTNPPSASTMAPAVDAVYYAVLGLAVFIAVGVSLLIIYFCFKYRRGSRADRSNPPSRNLKLEVGWIITPILLSLGVFTWASRMYFDLYAAPRGAMVINVVGKQWMWKLQHPEGRREINELHVPTGRAVELRLQSQDVIHSFYVPAFRIKQDALPGRVTSTWFQATKPGRYHLFCAQYCGTDHANMQGWVIVMKPADFDTWLRGGQTSNPTVEAGARLFTELGCSGCHSAGSSVRAPMLDGLYGRPVPLPDGRVVTADEQWIHDCILYPKTHAPAGFKPLMPSFNGRVTEEQLQQLVAFVKSLSDKDRILSR